MEKVDLDEIYQKVLTFVQDRDWDQFHSIKNLSMALSVEASELMEIFQWMKEEESNKVAENHDLKIKLEDEVADVFIYLLRIIKKADINLEQVVNNKLQKNILKYPVEKCKGSAKKYTDL